MAAAVGQDVVRFARRGSGGVKRAEGLKTVVAAQRCYKLAGGGNDGRDLICAA
jgi:hypothetical protein